jgi:hypothetical protein
VEMRRTVTLSTTQRPKSVADIQIVVSQHENNKETTLSRGEMRSLSEERKTVTPKQSPMLLIGDGLERLVPPSGGNNMKSNTSLMSGEEAASGKMGYVRYSTKRSK